MAKINVILLISSEICAGKMCFDLVNLREFEMSPRQHAFHVGILEKRKPSENGHTCFLAILVQGRVMQIVDSHRRRKSSTLSFSAEHVFLSESPVS